MFIDETLVLKTESDVEQKVVMPLLTDRRLLAIPEGNLYIKQYLAPAALDKAAGKLNGYYPDYSIWFHGLPTMVVEVKSPDVAAEEGYREASLYARHLNQRFPADFNPCARIMGTNGKAFLFGSWDAPPDVALSLTDLRVATSGLESVRARCSGQVLAQFALRLSQQLKLTNVVFPYEMLGGRPRLMPSFR
jgi:hypothetical protein